MGGLAVAVHTTQFEIRKPEVGLFEPVPVSYTHLVSYTSSAAERSGRAASTSHSAGSSMTAPRAVLISLSLIHISPLFPAGTPH